MPAKIGLTLMPSGGCLGWPAPITIRSGSASGNGLAAESRAPTPKAQPKSLRRKVAAVDQWLSVLDDLLLRPFPADADVHHVDLRVSEDFWDCQTRDEIHEPRCAEFEADRDRLVQAITNRCGAPQPRDLMPYVSGDPPHDEPGSLLFGYLAGWFCEVDVWQVGDRGIIVEVGHYDKELPLQLMLVVGDIGDGRTSVL